MDIVIIIKNKYHNCKYENKIEIKIKVKMKLKIKIKW